MTFHAGSVPAGTSLYIPFTTYAGSTGASATCTGLAVTDVEIYKNGSTTQRASDAGIALLDTDGIDFDGITGLHGFSIDLSDNTDSGFFAVGSWYWVVVSAITVDSQTVTFLAATFRIAPAESITGYPVTDIGGISGDSAAADNLESACDNYSATRGLAGTALPNAAADAAGGLPISDAGGLDLDAQIGTKINDILDDTGTTGVLLSTTALGAIWNRLTSSLTTVGSIGKWIVDNLTGDIYARLGAPAGASIAADIAALKAETATIVVDTNELQTDWANGGRLDLILDARSSQTSVDDIPTNAELAVALATGVNVTQVDGSNLGTHGIGQFPADVRDWGGLGATIAIDADNSAPSVAVSHIHDDVISAAAVSAAAVTKIQNGIATASELLLVKDRVSYCLTVLVGACSDAGTSAETYVHSIGGETFTVDYTGLDLTGNRTTTTLSKV